MTRPTDPNEYMNGDNGLDAFFEDLSNVSTIEDPRIRIEYPKDEWEGKLDKIFENLIDILPQKTLAKILKDKLKDGDWSFKKDLVIKALNSPNIDTSKIEKKFPELKEEIVELK